MAIKNRFKLQRKIASSRVNTPTFCAEVLELRTLMTGAGTLITVGADGYSGTAPLQVTAGQSVTLTADVLQRTNGTAVNASPTGTLGFYWDQTQGFPAVFIGNASSSAIITPIYDTQYTGTFTLNPVPFLETDNFGDQLIIAIYNGDSNIPAGSSFTPINNDENYPSTQIDPNKGFVPVDFTQATAPTLSVTAQPSDAAVDATIDPPISVEVLNGTAVDTAADSITASITAGSTGTGTLLGTTTVSTVAGVATFSNLSINAQGKYSLTFTDSNDLTTASDAFQIGSGLKVEAQPTTTSPGDAIEPAVTVAVVNGAGKPDTTAAPTAITASLSSDSTGAGTLGGTLTATTAKGIAKFTNLRIDKPGQYTLNFSNSDGANAPSISFTVSSGRLMFVGRIGKGVPGTALNPAVKVELVDKHGHRLTDVSSLVTLNITGINASDPISGNSIQLVDGVAIFSSLEFAQPGDYTLTATDDEADATATSNPIAITGLHLVIKIPPGEVSANVPLKYEVDLEDYKNRVVNDSTIGLVLSLNPVDGDANAALSSSVDIFNSGRATNSGSSPASVDLPGTYTITYSPVMENSDVNYQINSITSKPFEVIAYHLVFVKKPSTVLPGYPLIYEVKLEDYKKRLVITRPDMLTFTLIPTSSSSTGTLTANTDELAGGLATNAGDAPLKVTAAGTYQLMVTDIPAVASDAVAASVTSLPFKVGIKIFG